MQDNMKKLSDLIKNSIIYIFPVFALILSLYAKETSQAARSALYLCLDVVIPSLFPFFVLSRLTIPYLSSFSCPKFLKSLAQKFFNLPYYTLITIILGYLSGSPTGSKLARDMMDDGLLDAQQASKLIAISNNCSPLFLVGTIGAGLFKSIKIGFLLLLIHWLSGFIAAFFTGRLAVYNTPQTKSANKVTLYTPNKCMKRKETGLFYLIPSAVEEAAVLCIKVTGYIVLFAVLSELLARLGFYTFISGTVSIFLHGNSSKGSFSDFIASLLRGFMEITSGSQSINQLQDASINIKLAAISLVCGFAGLSVHTQVMGIMKGTGVKYRIFFTGKLLQGIIACMTTFLVTTFVPMSVQTSTLAASSPLDFSSIRLLTVGVLLLSLSVAPYKNETNRAPKRL